MVKASDIVQEQYERKLKKRTIYKKIYKRIETKILQASNMNLNQCWYEIPEFLFNIPLYNIDECKVYLNGELKKDGFTISFNNNIIIISWPRK